MSIKELECYQIIYKNLLTKVLEYYQMHQFTVTFSVPVVFVGNDTYNLKKCLVFLIKKMRDNGYQINYKHPNILIIQLKQHGNTYTPHIPRINKKVNEIPYNQQKKNIVMSSPSLSFDSAKSLTKPLKKPVKKAQANLSKNSRINDMLVANFYDNGSYMRKDHNHKKIAQKKASRKPKKKYITDQSVLNILRQFEPI